MDTNQILLWVATGGGAALIFSWVAERVTAYQNLSTEWKQAVYYIGVGVLSVLAYAGIRHIPADVIAVIDPYVKVIFISLGLGAGGTLWHSVRKENTDI